MRDTNREVFTKTGRRASFIVADAKTCKLYDEMVPRTNPGDRRAWDGIDIAQGDVPPGEMHWIRMSDDGRHRELVGVTKFDPAPAPVELGDDGLSRVIDALKDAGDRGANGDQIFGWMRAIAVEVRAQRQNAARIESANTAIHASFEKIIERLDERLGDLDMSKLKAPMRTALDFALSGEKALHPADPPEWFDVVFDGPPGPTSGRFVEVEDQDGKSINVGRWINRGNGLWALRIGKLPNPNTHRQSSAENALDRIRTMLGLKTDTTVDKVFETIDYRLKTGERMLLALTQASAAIDDVVQRIPPADGATRSWRVTHADPTVADLDIAGLAKEVADANEAEVGDPAPSKR